MLRGLFDTLDEASYVESKDALLQLLQTRVWPLLGISQHIHDTVYAWIHFRQFAVTGENTFDSQTISYVQGMLNASKWQHIRGQFTCHCVLSLYNAQAQVCCVMHEQGSPH